MSAWKGLPALEGHRMRYLFLLVRVCLCLLGINSAWEVRCLDLAQKGLPVPAWHNFSVRGALPGFSIERLAVFCM